MEPPIQLISIITDSEGKDQFELNEEALDVIKKVDTPLAIFSMCGQLGLGKSYLLNCIFDFFEDDGVSKNKK